MIYLYKSCRSQSGKKGFVYWYPKGESCGEHEQWSIQTTRTAYYSTNYIFSVRTWGDSRLLKPFNRGIFPAGGYRVQSDGYSRGTSTKYHPHRVIAMSVVHYNLTPRMGDDCIHRRLFFTELFEMELISTGTLSVVINQIMIYLLPCQGEDKKRIKWRMNNPKSVNTTTRNLLRSNLVFQCS